MADNLLLHESVLKYIETELNALAIADKKYKLVWFNKQFKNLFPGKRLSGKSLLKITGKTDSFKFNNSEEHDLLLPFLNSNIRMIPISRKKNTTDGYLVKVEPVEIKYADIYNDEIFQNNLLFQKELQNILSLLLRERSLKVISEELLVRCISISKGNFGLVVFHNEMNKYTFQYYDPEKILSNRPDIEKEINGNFSFLSKWFSLNNRSLVALNINDNIGYNLARIFQSHA
jgi:hypothetical protein